MVPLLHLWISFFMSFHAYILALLANMSFALGSQFYARFSRTISSMWMNAAKAAIGGTLFFITVSLFYGWQEVHWLWVFVFACSGFLGLGVGDWFLLKSFANLGPGRTMVLFSFQPLVVGTLSYFIFGQTLDMQRIWALFFLIACVLIFAHENKKVKGSLHLHLFAIAAIGMCLDGVGIVITRYAFEHWKEITPVEANFYRAMGAWTFFFLFSFIRPYHFVKTFKRLHKKDLFYVFISSFLAMFLSLFLFLQAVQFATLATLTGVSITGTIFAALFECIMEKKMPSKHLLLAFVFFLVGTKFLLF